MALQGTIDAFPIPDVLRLLGSSQKSGELLVTGTANHAAVWIAQGTVLGGTTTRSSVIPPVLAVFETLRIADGAFEFSSVDLQDLPESGFDPVPVEDALRDAEELSNQWVNIQEIVPSLQHELKLAAQLPTDRVAIDQDMWELITNIGITTSVGDLAVVLDIGEFEVCARTAALVESGLMSISAPRIRSVKKESAEFAASTAPEKAVSLEADPGIDPHRLNGQIPPAAQPESANGVGPAQALEDIDEDDFPDKFPIDDLVNEDDADVSSHWDSLTASQDSESSFDALGALGNDDYLEFEPAEEANEFAPEIEVMPLGGVNLSEASPHGTPAQSGDSTDEVLRQMSKLSPQAAEAIAAAMRPGASGFDARSEAPSNDDEITFLDTL